MHIIKAKGANVCFDHNNDYDGSLWVLSTRWKKNNIDISLADKIINLSIGNTGTGGHSATLFYIKIGHD